MEGQRLIFSFAGAELKATLQDNVTTRDLVKRLPLKLNMKDLFQREKYAKVQGLNVDQTIASYDKGDFSYWTSGETVVIFYKEDKEHINGLVKLGEIMDDVEILENYPGDVEVVIDMAK